jgi:hypothetical protein
VIGCGDFVIRRCYSEAVAKHFYKIIGLIALSLCAVLVAVVPHAEDGRGMDENQLSQKLEDAYTSVKSAENEQGKAFDIYVEQLSYLVMVAGSRSSGSDQLDEVFGKIQKESPTLVVPRFVMTPAELETFIGDIASDDANDLAYSTYQRRVRTMSEWIQEAKHAITIRSGFEFDPSVKVVHSQ